MMTDTAPQFDVRTLRLKVKREAYPWLHAAAVEVNQVWNYCNATAERALRPYVGKGKWLTGFDLCNLTSGATHHFEHIGADTINDTCLKYADKRNAVKRPRLKWRASKGSKRALGWVPFKAASIKRKAKSLRFAGKAFRVFEFERLADVKWRDGCFAEDALGDWWLCLPVRVPRAEPTAPRRAAVGIDLGLKDCAVTSDGARLERIGFYRDVEKKIAQAQRRGHKRQAKRLHRKAANRRKDALHKFSRAIVNEYGLIAVGDVSSVQLARTKMAKAVLDSGWSMLRSQLEYKGQQARRRVMIVNERNTTRACGGCGALTGPRGRTGLVVREWSCGACGAVHDRDVNAARNILTIARAGASASVGGNEPNSSERKPPSRARRPREAGIARARKAA